MFTYMGGSHIPVLKKVLDITDGDVLELGAGWYSTPLLFWTCLDSGRKLMSLESDLDWVNELNGLALYIHHYDYAPIEKEWDVVFIDHAPAERRIVDIKRLVNYAKYIVIHDSEPESEDLYHYSEIYPLFKYKYTYDKHKPHTTVLSNYKEFTL